MRIISNDTHFVIVNVVAFKIGEGSDPVPNDFKLVEPRRLLQHTDFPGEPRAIAVRWLPGRTETYSPTGENVCQIHRADNEDNRTPIDGDAEIFTPENSPSAQGVIPHPTFRGSPPMELDEQITLTKSLVTKRQEVDEQLAALFAGAAPPKKSRRCEICDGEGHTLRFAKSLRGGRIGVSRDCTPLFGAPRPHTLGLRLITNS